MKQDKRKGKGGCMKPTLQDGINMLSDDELKRKLKKREQYIEENEKPIITPNKEMSYRCVEQTVTDDNTNEILSEGIILQFKWWQDDEWIDVTDLTDLKIWEYNKLVDELNKHYPDYPIEYLEGRFV